jgi:hypothetical protein
LNAKAPTTGHPHRSTAALRDGHAEAVALSEGYRQVPTTLRPRGGQSAVECPPWCVRDVPSDDAVMHLSADRVVTATNGPERHHLEISVDRIDDPGAAAGVPSIRLEGSSSVPMTPVEALSLAAELQTAALTALTNQDQVGMPVAQWAREYLASPVADESEHRIRAIVADLLDQLAAEQQVTDVPRPRTRRANARRI